MAAGYWERFGNARATRRRLLQAGAGAAGLALVGCGDSGGTKQPAATTTGGSPTAEPALRGGTVRLPNLGLGFLYPFDKYIGAVVQNASANHYSRLLRSVARADIAIEDLTVLEGDLASRFEQVDPLTYVFTLKPNVRWQNKAPLNGREVTADDYVKSYNAFARDQLAFPFGRDFVLVVDKIEATDAKTVKVTLKFPYAPFLRLMAAADAGPWLIPVETIESGQVNTDPVGTGPFMLREFVANVSAKWERNPDYFDAPLPNFDALHWGPVLFKDMPAAIAALQTGDLDAVNFLGGSIPFREVRPKLNPGGQEFIVQSAVQSNLHFNFDNKPFQDRRVRQAISMMLDRTEMLRREDGTLNGAWLSHIPAALPPFYLNPQRPEFGPNARYFKHNLTEAKALLSAAGAEGLAFKLIATDRYGPAAARSYDLVVAALKEGGLQPELVVQPYDPYVRSTYLGNMPPDSAALGPLLGEANDPDDVLARIYWTKSIVKNWGGTPIAEQSFIDADIEKQRTIFDVNERAAFIQEMQRKMAESMVMVPYYAIPSYVYVQPWMKNYFHKASKASAADSLMKAYFDADRIKKG